MTATPETLFAFLDSLGITHATVTHPPIYTVEEGRAWDAKIPGLSCKNLFLKDKKGQIWLVVMPGEKRAHLRSLAARLGVGTLSFGKPELLMEVLGVPAGSVTPFALMNDTAHRVRVVLDSTMMQAPLVNYHPLHNAASTSLTPDALARCLDAWGYSPQIMDCGDPA